MDSVIVHSYLFVKLCQKIRRILSWTSQSHLLLGWWKCGHTGGALIATDVAVFPTLALSSWGRMDFYKFMNFDTLITV